jgi:hypothetical protein
MAKQKINEGVMKYIVKMFFPMLDKMFLRDPEIQQSLKEISKHAAAMNDIIHDIEKRTGKDLSHLYLKHK